jgi:hypothetical protein
MFEMEYMNNKKVDKKHNIIRDYGSSYEGNKKGNLRKH